MSLRLRRKGIELAVVALDLAIASLGYVLDSYALATIFLIAALMLLIAILYSNF